MPSDRAAIEDSFQDPVEKLVCEVELRSFGTMSSWSRCAGNAEEHREAFAKLLTEEEAWLAAN